MDASRRERRARWARGLIAVPIVLVVVGLAIVAFAVLLGDRTSPVGVDEAVGRYQEENEGVATATSAPRDRPLPAEGVYVYVTEGQESIDLLGGSTHDYPAETTVTVSHTACGIRQRWEPLDQRWDDEELCVTEAGHERRRLHTHHEFFTIGDDAEFTCEPGYVEFPARVEVGATWTTACETNDTLLSGTGTVVGVETRDVAGVPVETVHVRITEQASGANTGPSSDDYWWRLEDGLLVERVSTVESHSDSPVGTANYTESYTLRLTSLEPRT